jgi:hypothetical protein
MSNGYHLFFIIMSTFFFGGAVRAWISNQKLDTCDKIGLVVHPIIVLCASLSLFKMAP